MKAIGKNSVSTILKYTLLGVYGLQWLAAGILVVLTVVSLLGGIKSPNIGLDVSFVDNHAPYEITTNDTQVEDVHLEIKGATLKWKAPAARFTTILGLLGAVGTLGITLFITWLLIKIMNTLVEDQPFIPDNAPRLNLIAWTLIAYTPVAFMAKILVNVYIKNTFVFSSGEVVLAGQLNWQPLFMGLIMLVVAELFRKGAILQEHEDLTV